MGGIASGRDAADFLAAGAKCVAVGTESFRDPAAGARVSAELDSFLVKSGVFPRAYLQACGEANPLQSLAKTLNLPEPS